MRRSILGRHGRVVVTALCAYEVVALRTPPPTISQVVGKCPAVGVALIGLLAHHWFVEQDTSASL